AVVMRCIVPKGSSQVQGRRSPPIALNLTALSGRVAAAKSMRVLISLIILLGMALCSIAKEGVVLLHGLCRTSGCMQQMSKALSVAGFSVENSSYPSRTGGIEKLSD